MNLQGGDPLFVDDAREVKFSCQVIAEPKARRRARLIS
jgi:hypothetical protein